MRIVTWNVNSIRVRIDQVRTWLDMADPDVLCLQETKITDKTFPTEAFAEAGYPHQAFYGQKTYNGVAIVSKHPLSDVEMGFATGEADPQKRLIKATVDGIRVVNCYVPNGNSIGSDKFAYKLQWLERFREELAETETSGDLAVVGDFNIAPEDLDIWDPFEQEGQLLCHPLEREALKRILECGLSDSYRTKKPMGGEYSWWDFRGMGFSRNRGIRIDLILLSRSLMDRCRKVKLWREVRGWERPSDHIPVVAHID